MLSPIRRLVLFACWLLALALVLYVDQDAGPSTLTRGLTTPDEHYPCGTPQHRRSLASRLNETTAKDWMGLAKCMKVWEQGLKAHYYLHVSKAGGTSMCTLFEQNNCKTTAKDYGFAECNYPGLGPAWTSNREIVERHNLPNYMLKDPSTQSWTCEQVEDKIPELKSPLFMTEQHMPEDGVCKKHFRTSTIIREPIQRIFSHYLFMKYPCTEHCEDFFTPQNTSIFDGETMIKYFPETSDNYFTRTLGGKAAFDAKLGDITEQQKEHALNVLDDMDWVMILGSDLSTEKADNNLILQHGLGLMEPLPDVRSQSRTKALYSMDEASLKRLRELNDNDYKIWERAQLLHRLDVLSLKALQEHAPNYKPKHLCQP